MISPSQPYLANSIWKRSSKKSWQNFLSTCKDPATIQINLLRNILHANQISAFGRQHQFAAIQTVEHFQQQVPISSYEDYSEAIRQILNGEQQILTTEGITRLEPTSGTSSASKYIPSTEGLRKEFQRAIGAWIYNLMSTYPELMAGRAYWFVSPPTQVVQPEKSAVPIGFAQDSDYLSFWERELVKQLMVMPTELSAVTDMDNHAYLSLLFLLREENLRLISIWNPTSLIMLLERINNWQDILLHDLSSGTLTTPSPLPSDQQKRFRRMFSVSKQRSRVLQSALSSRDWATIWPDLALISCWADGWAKNEIPELQAAFPGVPIQPKGLLATEGVVTIPIQPAKNEPPLHVLTVNSHFYEFEHTTNGEIYTADSLSAGTEYHVLITTSGGLYRYRLNDRVLCNGFFHRAPCLTFLGKVSGFSDLCGEKVSEAHLRAVVEKAYANQSISSAFFFVAPALQKKPSSYCLFYTTDSKHNYAKLATDIERGLCENYHYQNCRSLHQLAAFQILQLPTDAAKSYHRFRAKSAASGTIKPRFLEQPNDWQNILT